MKQKTKLCLKNQNKSLPVIYVVSTEISSPKNVFKKSKKDFIHNNMTKHCRAPSSKKWNFRTQFLENFRTISGHFCRFHEAQDTEKAKFYVLINVIHWSRSVLQSKKCY